MHDEAQRLTTKSNCRWTFKSDQAVQPGEPRSMNSRTTRKTIGAGAALSSSARESDSAREWVRRAFPLADGVTYVYAAGVMAATWVGADLLEKLGAALGITR